MKPLIDGDILRYEIGFAAETGWQDDSCRPPFDYVLKLLELRIDNICAMVEATEKPTIYLSGKNNFRDKIAKTRPYKGSRKENKPWHYNNLTAYLTSGAYEYNISDGYEADDAMAIEQYARWNCNTGPAPSIICSRDKDLRMVPGWHYSWELGRQPSFGPEYVDEIGKLEYNKSKNKLTGTGLSFFYSQMLMGDTVDNIPGLPKYGPKRAFYILSGRDTPEDLYLATRDEYRAVQGHSWKDYMLEQGRLLWMIRELDDNGDPVMWELME